MKPVAIISNRPGIIGIPFGQEIDVWGMNLGAYSDKRYNAIFEMHTLKYMLDTRPIIYFAWLSNQKIPIYARERISDTTILYPFDDVYKLTGKVIHKNKRLKYFTSTATYAVAMAILQKRPKISLYNFEMKHESEYGTQRESFAFWVGFAAGRGIELEIIGSDSIFDQPLYGET
jgi:hypothetical protein